MSGKRQGPQRWVRVESEKVWGRDTYGTSDRSD